MQQEEEESSLNGSHVYKECKLQEYPIVSVDLGLQHGIALDCMGQVFCWGKGERGQLGLGRRSIDEALRENNDNHNYVFNNPDHAAEEEPYENKTIEYPMQVTHFYDPYATLPSPSQLQDNPHVYAPTLSPTDSKIRLIGAGMNFSLAITESNLPYIWGKNCIPNPDHNPNNTFSTSKSVMDSTYPRYIPGLPSEVPIVRVACGSHHASFLLQDGSIYAVGVATDRPLPLWKEAVQIFPPDIVDISTLVSFTAGFDRTFLVYGDDDVGRRQVIEIQLWSTEEMRWNGSVRPSWVDWLEECDAGGVVGRGSRKVQSVHRGWMHTVIITEETT